MNHEKINEQLKWWVVMRHELGCSFFQLSNSFVKFKLLSKYLRNWNIIYVSCIGIFHAASLQHIHKHSRNLSLCFQGILRPYQWINIHPGILCQIYSKPTVLLGWKMEQKPVLVGQDPAIAPVTTQDGWSIGNIIKFELLLAWN